MVAWMKSWGVGRGVLVAWMKSWGREEVLVSWMKSWGVGGGDGGMVEELQGGRRS